MHEASLARTIFRSLEQELKPDELERLSKVHLKLGKLSNVEPALMKSAFEAVRDADKKFDNVALEIEQVPIAVKCPSCHEISEVENFSFKCAACGTPTIDLISGKETLISHVEFRD